MKISTLGMLLVLWTVALFVAPTPVKAQARKGPCGEDLQKFCAGIQSGGGRYRDCLKQHEAELSAACQEHLKQMQARVASWRQACEGDVQKLCSGIESGGGKVAKCLREHRSELSASCKEQLAKGQHRHRSSPATPAQ